jgi:hypothetical protein
VTPDRVTDLAVAAYVVIAAFAVAVTVLTAVLPAHPRKVKRDQALARILAFSRGKGAA